MRPAFTAFLIALAGCHSAPAPLRARAPTPSEARTRLGGLLVGETHVVLHDATPDSAFALDLGKDTVERVVDVPSTLREVHWLTAATRDRRIVALAGGMRGESSSWDDLDWDTAFSVSSDDGGVTWRLGPELSVPARFGDPQLAFEGLAITVEVSTTPPPGFLERLGVRKHDPADDRLAWRSRDLGLHWSSYTP